MMILGDDKDMLQAMVEEIDSDLSGCTASIQMHQVFRPVTKKANMFLTMERVGAWARWSAGYIRHDEDSGVSHIEWDTIDEA